MEPPNSPTSSQNEEAIIEALWKEAKPSEGDNTSVASWLLKDLSTHKERIIKGGKQTLIYSNSTEKYCDSLQRSSSSGNQHQKTGQCF
jgi:hypothetical protein